MYGCMCSRGIFHSLEKLCWPLIPSQEQEIITPEHRETKASLPLKASVVPGAWFLSGWNLRASLRYAFFRSSSEAALLTPRIS